MTDSFNGWEAQNIPYSQEAEEATIGSVLVGPNCFLELESIIKSPDDFFILRHKYIWQAIKRINERGEPLDYLILAEELRAMDKLADIGGPAYLTQLINSTPTSVHAAVYASLVAKAAGRRRLMAHCDEIKALAQNEDVIYEEVFLEAQQRLDALMPEDRSQFTRGIDSIDVYDNMRDDIERKRTSGQMVAYPWPESWSPITEFIPSIYPGDFMIISGLEGSGKSSALEELAEHLAGKGLPSQYIHTEMSSADVFHRRMARHSGVSFDTLKSGNETPGQITLTNEAEYRMKSTFIANISYKWFPDVKFTDLQLHLKRQAAAGVKVFVIDHFQDIEVEASKDGNPVRGYEKAVKWLAAFAEFRNVLIILASQENQQGKTKWSSKLREKAFTLISIKSAELATHEEFIITDPATKLETEIRYKIGEINPFHAWVIAKARFGRKGKVKMFNHGGRFRWMEPSLVRKPRPIPPPPAQYKDSIEAFESAALPANSIPLFDDLTTNPPPAKSKGRQPKPKPTLH